MNIIRAGVMMITYMFMVIVAYFLLSTPVELILGSFEGGNFGAATEHLDTHIPTMRTVFQMFFALLAAVPITWFIFWVSHREPDWGYQ